MLPSALAAKLCRVPHVWHIREFYSDFPSFWWVYQRLMAFCSSKIICVSTPVQLQFSEQPRKKTVVLHNGFPADEFKPVSPERVAAFCEEYQLTAPKLVGVVGRLKLKRKGQETFIAAARQIAKKHPDVQFLLIGSVFPGNEEHEEELRRLAASLGDQVRFTGDVEDIKAAYAALDVVVMPSGMPEPFGGVAIEAMAMSRPVIATNIGGSPEQVEDEKTGILFPPDDASELANALDRLLSDSALAQTMGSAGRVRFEELFEFDPFYKKIMAVYHSVVRPV